MNVLGEYLNVEIKTLEDDWFLSLRFFKKYKQSGMSFFLNILYTSPRDSELDNIFPINS